MCVCVCVFVCVGMAATDPRSQMAVTYCMGSVVCPAEASKFMSSLEAGAEAEAAERYSTLEARLGRYNLMARKLKLDGRIKE